MLRYASSDPPVRPSPRTRRSLKLTIGSLNPPSPSVAHPAIANTASAAAASFVLRLVILLIFLAPFFGPAKLSPGLLCFPANLSPRVLYRRKSLERHAKRPPRGTRSWTLLPSDQPTIGGVWRLPSRIQRVQARRRRCRATPPADTLAGCMPLARCGHTGTPRYTPTPSSGGSARSGCALEPALPGSRARHRAQH